MRKNNWLMYSIYSIVLLCYIIFSSKILIYEKEQFQRTFNNVPLIIWSIVIFIVLGLLLGLEKFLSEKKKDGRWKVNLSRLVLLGIPSLYFSLGIMILSIPITFVRYPILYLLKYEDILSIFQVILGYIIITSFIKEKE
ncbi:hypothetical protein D2A34_01835 [Clostridium chromiireducens]|uniref:Uncharacterized protein n=1 Tax=Clostridium chromiireducens TaxID=225345 RepID=A0A399IV40_9CLOT|nr:hypothetical protein [Clostridium chromiireducens]RII36139.1 hypothetical protein D2A34_01835 [Clostridium chromiireducens]